jgi:hypothetical protein
MSHANHNVIEQAKRKAGTSSCRFKISATGFDKRGNVIGCATNKPRFVRKGGGIHAEAALIRRYGKRLRTILICRVNRAGDMLPIDPCKNCSELAEKFEIKIISLKS